MTGPLLHGEIVHGRYEIDRYIAEGGMQYVYAARDTLLNRIVACKTPKNSSAEKRFKRSAVVAARVNHPNVAKVLDYVEDGNRQFLIEEFIDGTDLKKALLTRIDYLDPFLAARVFHYLVRGLAASHHVGVIHRDLKPTNIMVVGDFQLDEIKITDFGIAKLAEEELVEAAEGGEESISSSKTAVGALPYMSPELIETPRDVNTPTDIWSIGAMMYELLTGQKPFGMGYAAISRILKVDVSPVPDFLTTNPQFSYLAGKLISLIMNCLQKSPEKRPDADTLVNECINLCYPVCTRYFGQVHKTFYDAYGFIDHGGEDIFFHYNCVYGERPELGDNVMFSKYEGGGAWRALPVVRLSLP